MTKKMSVIALVVFLLLTVYNVSADIYDDAYLVPEKTEYSAVYTEINTLINSVDSLAPGGRKIHACYSKFDTDTFPITEEYQNNLGTRNQGTNDCVAARRADPSIVETPENTYVACIRQVANPIDSVYYGKLLEHAKIAKACMESGECEIKGNYDGVVADGESEISFYIEVPGTISLDTSIESLGEITQQTESAITFKPYEADAEHKYLDPKEILVKANCDSGDTKDRKFTIEQPPLLLVHGIRSNALKAWPVFENWFKAERWTTKPISYTSSKDITNIADDLRKEIATFVQEIMDGKIYSNKKIMVTKIDIVAHSMGGVVSRYYTTDKGVADYNNDVRKLVMIATPNYGSFFMENLPDFIEGTDFAGGTALSQLRPGSDFMNYLNDVGRTNPDVKYHAIAGTGWSTKWTDGETYSGDGVVATTSVKLAGASFHCTWDAHNRAATKVKKITQEANTAGGKSILDSKFTYKIVTNLLLTDTASSNADCNADPTPFYFSQRGYLYSPATIHAYDENGNHLGLDENGEIENEIGDGAYYFPEDIVDEHPAIQIFSNKEKTITFKVVGTADGTYSLDIEKAINGETVFEQSFENIQTNPNTQHLLDITQEIVELVQESVGIQEQETVVVQEEEQIIEQPEEIQEPERKPEKTETQEIKKPEQADDKPKIIKPEPVPKKPERYTKTTPRDYSESSDYLIYFWVGLSVTLLLLAMFIFWVWMFIDCIVRHGVTKRFLWIIIILIFGFFGAVIYFFVARRKAKKKSLKKKNQKKKPVK